MENYIDVTSFDFRNVRSKFIEGGLTDKQADIQIDAMIAVVAKIGATTQALQQVDYRVDRLEAKIDNLIAMVEVRFEGVDTKFGAVYSRFDSVYSRFDSIQKDINALSLKLNWLIGILSTILISTLGAVGAVVYKYLPLVAKLVEAVK